MSSTFRQVKEFEFPAGSGFSGSAGKQSVKGYCRGGGVKPKGHAIGGAVMPQRVVAPVAPVVPQRVVAPGAFIAGGLKKGGKVGRKPSVKIKSLKVKRVAPPVLPPEAIAEPVSPLTEMAAPAQAPRPAFKGRFNSEPMYGGAGVGMKKGGTAKSKC